MFALMAQRTCKRSLWDLAVSGVNLDELGIDNRPMDLQKNH